MRRTKKYSLGKEQRELVTARISRELEKRPEIVFAFLHGSFLYNTTAALIQAAAQCGV